MRLRAPALKNLSYFCRSFIHSEVFFPDDDLRARADGDAVMTAFGFQYLSVAAADFIH